ncbi:31726_t:CDS:2, partial [Racocetra persica]
MACKINVKGFNLIKEFEGFWSNYYIDPAGYKTFGYGHACHANDCTNIKPPLTKAQAEDLLRKDLIKFENTILPYLKKLKTAILRVLLKNLASRSMLVEKIEWF